MARYIQPWQMQTYPCRSLKCKWAAIELQVLSPVENGRTPVDPSAR